MIGDMPPPLLTAAREPFAAQAVVFALLLSRTTRPSEQASCRCCKRRSTSRCTARRSNWPRRPSRWRRGPAVAGRSERAGLKRSSPQQYAQFRQTVNALVNADGKVDLFEYCLRTVLFSYLDVSFGLKKPPAVRYRSIDAVAEPLAVVLSTLAYVGQHGEEDIERAFQRRLEESAGPGGDSREVGMHAWKARRRAGRVGPIRSGREARRARRGHRRALPQTAA